VDAVYIALPNSMHREYTVRAASHGVHVLCEKPLAVAEADCKAMIDACRRHGVKLMTAYRLHFERATRLGRPVRLEERRQRAKLSMRREMTRPPVRMPRTAYATPPSG
jgi:hypothetical protein